jgi:MFS superfamily sulfate permease-like transporter
MSECPNEIKGVFKYKINGACIFGDGDDFEKKITFLLILVSFGFLLAIWFFIRKTNRILDKMTTPNPDVSWEETYCIFSKWAVLTI